MHIRIGRKQNKTKRSEVVYLFLGSDIGTTTSNDFNSDFHHDVSSRALTSSTEAMESKETV